MSLIYSANLNIIIIFKSNISFIALMITLIIWIKNYENNKVKMNNF